MRRSLSVFLVIAAMSTPAAAFPITFNTLDTTSLAAFYVGTQEYVPTGSRFTQEAAQTFTALHDFLGASGEILLGSNGNAAGHPFIDLALAIDGGTAPGSVIASQRINLIDDRASARRYAFDFGDVRLNDGQRYWLLATSPYLAERGPIGSGLNEGLAGWVKSYHRLDQPRAFNRNNRGWQFEDRSMAFSMEGTVIGDTIENGDLPQPRHRVPQPSTLMLLSLGGVFFWQTRSAKRRH